MNNARPTNTQPGIIPELFVVVIYTVSGALKRRELASEVPGVTAWDVVFAVFSDHYTFSFALLPITLVRIIADSRARDSLALLRNGSWCTWCRNVVAGGLVRIGALLALAFAGAATAAVGLSLDGWRWYVVVVPDGGFVAWHPLGALAATFGIRLLTLAAIYLLINYVGLRAANVVLPVVVSAGIWLALLLAFRQLEPPNVLNPYFAVSVEEAVRAFGNPLPSFLLPVLVLLAVLAVSVYQDRRARGADRVGLHWVGYAIAAAAGVAGVAWSDPSGSSAPELLLIIFGGVSSSLLTVLPFLALGTVTLGYAICALISFDTVAGSFGPLVALRCGAWNRFAIRAAARWGAWAFAVPTIGSVVAVVIYVAMHGPLTSGPGSAAAVITWIGATVVQIWVYILILMVARCVSDSASVIPVTAAGLVAMAFLLPQVAWLPAGQNSPAILVEGLLRPFGVLTIALITAIGLLLFVSRRPSYAAGKVGTHG